MVDAGCLSSESTASPPLVNLVAVKVFVLRGQFCKRGALSLAPEMIRWGQQDLGMERACTRTERCTVGYAGRKFLCGVAWRIAGGYGYLLPRHVPFYREGDSLSPLE